MKKTNPKADSLHSVIRYILYGTSLLSPLVFYPFIHNFSNLPKTAFIQFALCLVLLIWVVKNQRNNLSLVRHPVILAIGVWLFFSGISIFWAIDRFSGITLWLHWVICSFGFLVIINTIKEIHHLDTLILFSTIGASLISIIGCLQYMYGMDLIPQAFIPGGTFYNRNVLAQYIVMIWPFSLLIFLLNKNKRRHGLFAFMYSIQLLILLYTKTRAAWIAILLSCAMFIAFIFFTGFYKEIKTYISREKLLYMIGSIIMIIYVANLPPFYDRSSTLAGNVAFANEISPNNPSLKKSLPKKSSPPPGNKTLHSNQSKGLDYRSTLLSISKYNEGSGQVRLVMWVNSLGILKDHFLLGIGLGNFYILYPKYHSYFRTDHIFSLKQQPTHLHNDFFQLMLETSPAGFISFSFLLLVIFWRFISAFRLSDDPGVKLRLVFLTMAIVNLLIDSFFSFPLRMAIPPFFLMITLGMIVAIDISVTGSFKTMTLPFKRFWKNTLLFIVFLFLMFSGYFNITRILADHHYLKSAYLNSIKKWDPARSEAEKAVSYIPWRYKIWYELATAYENLGLVDNAIQAFEKTLAIHPYLLNSQLKLSHAYMKKGDVKKTEFWVEKALSINPDMDLALYYKGIVNEKLGKPKLAKEYYLKVINMSPKFPEAFLRLGIINLKENKIKTSKNQLEKAFALKPDLEKINFQLGTVYTRLNLLQKAFKAFQKELYLSPKNAKAHTGLGLVYAKQKKWDSAIASFKKAIHLNPDLGEAHMNIAVTYFYIKAYDLSLQHTKIAQKHNIPQANILKKKLDAVMAAQ